VPEVLSSPILSIPEFHEAGRSSRIRSGFELIAEAGLIGVNCYKWSIGHSNVNLSGFTGFKLA
jgi:hypothetical protein